MKGSQFPKNTKKRVDAYVLGRQDWEEQRPYSPPDHDDVAKLKYRQGYDDAKRRSEAQSDG